MMTSLNSRIVDSEAVSGPGRVKRHKQKHGSIQTGTTIEFHTDRRSAGTVTGHGVRAPVVRITQQTEVYGDDEYMAKNVSTNPLLSGVRAPTSRSGTCLIR